MRTHVLLAALAFGVAGCGAIGVSGEVANEGRTGSIAAHGLALELPPGWDGRIYRPSPVFAVETEAATVPLAEVGTGDEHVRAVWARMEPEDVYVRISDIGPPPSALVEALRCECRPTEGWEREDGSLRLRARDVVFPVERVPEHLGHAQRAVVLGNHALMIWVEFGARPVTPKALARANEVLGSLEVD